MQISRISSKDSDFPDVLRHIDRQVKSINILGILPKKQPTVAVIGALAPTTYGANVAYNLASELAASGIVILSGLGHGIEAAAHRGALDASGSTIAVVAHGLDHVYPARNKDLAASIIDSGGAILSEHDEGVPPSRTRFYDRCRVIGALADITVVVEAGIGDIALITTAEAIKAGRQVLAIPGNITAPTAAGSNNLLRSGRALAVTSATDVILELGFIAPPLVSKRPANATQAALLHHLKGGIGSSRDLMRACGLTHAQFADIISLMEITGKVCSVGAGMWVLR